jgi:serine/threonine protein kinase
MKKIGQGSFAKVFLGVRHPSGQKVAVKIIDYMDDKTRESADHEEHVLNMVRGQSPYLINCFDIFEEV